VMLRGKPPLKLPPWVRGGGLGLGVDVRSFRPRVVLSKCIVKLHCVDLLEVVAVMPRGKTLIKVPYVKKLNDTLTYRGIASKAVFTDPLVVAGFKRTVPYYYQVLLHCLSMGSIIIKVGPTPRGQGPHSRNFLGKS